MQGSKTNLINIVINDSLITDKELQDVYNLQILEELQKIIPANTRINDIKWNDNKFNSEQIIDGNFDVKSSIKNYI
jgi:hypothetical protein